MKTKSMLNMNREELMVMGAMYLQALISKRQVEQFMGFGDTMKVISSSVENVMALYKKPADYMDDNSNILIDLRLMITEEALANYPGDKVQEGKDFFNRFDIPYSTKTGNQYTPSVLK